MDSEILKKDVGGSYPPVFGYNGIVKINNKFYYNFNRDFGFGFQKINGEIYYFNDTNGNERGVMQTGDQKINGRIYHFNSQGILQPNLLDEINKAKNIVNNQGYTKESRTLLQDELNKAILVENNVNSSANDIISAIDSLRDKIKELKPDTTAAKGELTNKAQTADKAIDSLQGVDQKVKDQAKAEIQKALEAGNTAIDGSKTIPDVTKALDNAKNAIDNIYNGIDKTSKDNINNAKNKAKQDIDNAVSSADKTIDGLTNLTPEQKAKAKEDIKNDAAKAKENIDNATSPDTITKAANDGEQAINNDISNAKLQDAKNSAESNKNGFLPNVSIKTGDTSELPYILGLVGSLSSLGIFSALRRKKKK